MRAYQLTGTNGIASLEAVVRPDPVPGDGHILIRMRAASLNYRDLMVSRGRYATGSTIGMIPLSDGAGEVIAVGDRVRRFKIGDRVCPTFFRDWYGGIPESDVFSTALGGAVDGVLAELVVCDQHAAVRAPGHLSFEQAACLPCAALTAWTALYGPRPLIAGQTVLTLGTGGVSTFAIQFARTAGAFVIATSSSDAKLATARALGAGALINYTDHPEWENEVIGLTRGRGADHVVEVGGGGSLPRSIACAAVGGQIHMIGILTTGEINPFTVMGGKTLRGIMVGSRADFEAMNRAIEANRIEPAIDRVFDFDSVPDAYRHLESATHVGKVVIRFDG